MTSKVLQYDHSVTPQEQFYDCGPASTQVVLNGLGVILSEADLIDEFNANPNQSDSENPNGTDSVDVVADVLNQHVPLNYSVVNMQDDPPTESQTDQLWNDIVATINAGRGMVCNIVAPTPNYPVAVAPSTQSPSYGGGTVYHYIAMMGYSDDDIRRVWIADPGFKPYGYWISLDQLASLIPPKGYVRSTGGSTNVPSNTFWADVSSFQVGVNDSYPYQVFAFRSNDGTYLDTKCAHNLAWAKNAVAQGKLSFFIVYCFYRPNWQQTLDALKSQVGTPDPHMVVMIDVESDGGSVSGDQSDGINHLYWGITDWLGTSQVSGPRRVIGYMNTNDAHLWPTQPDHVPFVVPGYGNNPSYPGKFAHQYTDGGGYGGGLPEGAPPFGNCDMNVADGLSVDQTMATVGLSSGTPTPAPPTPNGETVDPRILTAALQFSQGWSVNEVNYTPDDPTAKNWAAAMLVVSTNVLTQKSNSRVKGSTYKGTLTDFILNTDAATFNTNATTLRTEQTVNALTAKVDALTTAVANLTAGK